MIYSLEYITFSTIYTCKSCISLPDPPSIQVCNAVHVGGMFFTTPRSGLMDYGSATFEDEEHEDHEELTTKGHCRAPEVSLNPGWSNASDTWSIGCILVELFTGDILFASHDNLDKKRLER